MKVCLCMMVRNESRVIERALDSAIPHVDAWFVADTGSTDHTPEIVERRMRRAGLPGRLHRTTFVDFGTSRTETVAEARRYCLTHGIEYLLLLDADVMLEVRERDWKRLLAGAPYSILYDDATAYRVPALIPSAVPWRYVGRTHEYIEPAGACPPQQPFDAVVLHDRADGGCKTDKFERDARLLQATLAERPNDERSWFYLGETYLNGNIDVTRALDAFTRRTELGGFEEEAWYAAYRCGHCLERLAGDQGDPWPAILAYFRAWERRPWRAEPLFEVVRYASHRGMHALGAASGQATLRHVIPRPERAGDVLFVDRPKHGPLLWDWTSICLWWSGHAASARELARRALASGSMQAEVTRMQQNLAWFDTQPPDPTDAYDVLAQATARLREHGLNAACLLVADAAEQLLHDSGREVTWSLDFDRSVCAWYVEGRHADGARLSAELLDRRDIPEPERQALHHNLQFYVKPLSPTILRVEPLASPDGTVPAGYAVTNPSLAFAGGRRYVVLRGVNYRIRDDGSYAFTDVIRTRNSLAELGPNDCVEHVRPFVLGPDVNEGEDGLVRGFEDCRIFAVPADGEHEGEATAWWMVANRSHPRCPERRAMYLLRLDISGSHACIRAAVHLHGVGDDLHQKNWMPVVWRGQMHFIYSIDPTIVVRADSATGRCDVAATRTSPFRGDDLRGGSELVELGEGAGWLTFVHGVLRESPTRRYFHRIVRFGPDLDVVGASAPFLLRAQQLEFVSGCARNGDELVLTWGEDDARAWIGRMSVRDAIALLK